MKLEIVDQLERARSQIEHKFSSAGRFLQETLDQIGRQIEALGRLNQVMGGDAVATATRDLQATAGYLQDLPAGMAARDTRLRALKKINARLHTRLQEMHGLVRYLRAFVLNVKITAGAMGAQAGQFQAFSAEMSSRIDHGERELSSIATNIRELDGQIDTAIASELSFAKQAKSMLPDVPDGLSADACDFEAYHHSVADMTKTVTELSRQIQMRVLNALSALQIGDIVRQRIEHVQFGLAELEALETRLSAGTTDLEERERLRGQVCAMLAAQLDDMAKDFDNEISRMLTHLHAMADDTKKLLLVQPSSGASGKQDGLRSLEQSVAKAQVLVSGMDQAAGLAERIQANTAQTVQGLVTRVNSLRQVKDDVQYMALNTTLRCVHIGEAGKPLQVVANELSLYAKRLEEETETTLATVSELATVADDRSGEPPSIDAQGKIASSVACLRAAAEVVESDVTQAFAGGEDLVRSLATAEDRLNFKSELLDVVYAAAESLRGAACEIDGDLGELAQPFQDLMDKIAAKYTMSRERDVHLKFAAMSNGVTETTACDDNEIELFA